MTIDEAGQKYPQDIDVENALKRMCGNEGLYLKFLNRFLDDPHYEAFCEAQKQGDREKAEFSVHTLKGLAGNLGLRVLYEQSAQAVDKLRQGKQDIDTVGLDQAYQKAIDIIKELD